MPAEAITRQILGGVPDWLVVVFYLLVASAVAWALLGIVSRVRKQQRAFGAKAEPKPSLGHRLLSIVRYLAFHERLLEDRYAGIAHLLVFYGFAILFAGTCIVFLESETPLHFFYGDFYQIASLIIDLGGLAFMIGLAMFLFRRHSGTHSRILRRWWVAALGWLLFVIGLSGFLLEAARLAVDLPAFERWSPVGYTMALGLRGLGIHGSAAESLHTLLWAGHAAVCVVFFALLPWMFFGHIFHGAARVSAARRRPISQLRTPPGMAVRIGADEVPALTTLDLAGADACTTCGRCNAVCPAVAGGKPLKPRDVILEIRSALDAAASDLSGTRLDVEDSVLWSCTTCGACNQACPVRIDVYDQIVELRRGRVESGDVPDVAASLFEGVAADSNPFGKPNSERLAWTGDLRPPVAEPGEEIPLLYWVGCAGSFDPDAASVSRAMVRVLEHLEIPYRILGMRERCTGDPARRMGEEGLFRDCAEHNITELRGHQVRRVLTHCAHCFNTFQNEYPEFGGDFEVEHHTQFLARQVTEGRLDPLALRGGPVSFHDPCYMGRGNGEIAAARVVLDRLDPDARREMPRHGKESFCCGAGGGSIWLDEPGDERIENLRAREAADTAPTVVTGCPYCKIMLEAGRQSLPDEKPLVVKDLAEWVVEQLPNEQNL